MLAVRALDECGLRSVESLKTGLNIIDDFLLAVLEDNLAGLDLVEDVAKLVAFIIKLWIGHRRSLENSGSITELLSVAGALGLKSGDAGHVRAFC